MLIFFLFFLIMILLSVAFFTLMERKMLSLMHWRLGPNKVIVGGYLQPVLDGVKLMTKIMFKNNKVYMIFMFPPIISFILSFLLWGIFFFSSMKLKILFFFIIMGLNSFVFILAGWSSFSKFSYLGGVRASSQTISYEISLTINMTVSIFFFYNLNLNYFTEKFFFFFFILVMLWGLIMLSETNRAPFDFSEGESELISGFNTEYSAVGFIYFMLSEYSMMIFFSYFVSSLLSMNFFLPLLMFFILTRSSFPRFRYDFLINLMWFKVLPFSCFLFSLIIIF